MANGKITLGKQSGGTLGLVFPDGVSDTEVVLPESGELIGSVGNQTIDGIKTFSSTIAGSINGNSATATKLQTARTIGGVSFDGSVNINLPGVNTTGNQNTTGNAATVTNGVYTVGDQTIAGVKTFSSTIAGSINGNSATATKLQTARTIGGVSFDGSANINLPGVNTTGNQNTTGNSATATKLQTARTIGGVSFDGSVNINLPGVNTTGNQNTTGNAATVTNGVYTVGDQTIDGIKTFSSTIAGSINGNSATATKLQTARTIGGVSFDGSVNINLPGVNTTGNQNTTGNAATVTNGVYTVGDQTIGGIKTFSSTIAGSINGNSATATKLATARTINGVSFDGTANITVVDSTKAPLASPSLTGVPTAPTAAAKTNTTQIATTAFVQYAITNQCFGVGQVWTDVKASRALGTTYTNSSGRPIEVFVTVNNTSPDGNYYISITIGGVLRGRQAASAAYATPGNQYASAQFTVPNGITYSVASSSGSLAYWQELR